MEVRERKLLRCFWFKSAERKKFDLFLFFFHLSNTGLKTTFSIFWMLSLNGGWNAFSQGSNPTLGIWSSGNVLKL